MQNHVCYRKFVPLRNGARVMLRLLTQRDRENLIGLFKESSEEDVRFLKHDVKNPGVVDRWLTGLDYHKVLPLMAVDLGDNRFVAGAALQRGEHAARHIGEIRIFVSAPFRSLGLGSVMLDELISLGTQENLYWLRAEVVTEQKQVIQSLRSRGFEVKATLEDFFLGKDGVTRDVLLMTRSLRQENEDTL
jgi:L-amino acid N-acyltransferase YncA